ncbi:MAG: hypothetical protein AB7D47_13475 [Desulfovibrio sp.]
MVGDSKNIEEIRRRTQARVEEEKALYASPPPRQEITPSFVLQCLDANEAKAKRRLEEQLLEGLQ